MGFRYRKSISVGKFFRINISTSGIGYSVGVPGMRYTWAANGSRYTTYSIPGTGLSYRQTHNGSQDSKYNGIVLETNLESANINNFRDADANDLLVALDKALIIDNVSMMLVIFGFLFCCLSVLSFWLLIAGCVEIVFGVFLKFLVQFKFRVELHYELDESSEQSYNERILKWKTFFSSKAVWQINSIGLNRSAKVNGGAAFSVTRSKIRLTKKLPYYINTNQHFIYFKLKSEKIILLPDRIIIFKSGRYGAINYDDIIINTIEEKFVEEGLVPRDALQVGKTWKFVNKNGTPDRRFNNNFLIPVCLYGYLTITSKNGLNIQLSCSNHNNINGFKTYKLS